LKDIAWTNPHLRQIQYQVEAGLNSELRQKVEFDDHDFDVLSNPYLDLRHSQFDAAKYPDR